jgi:hypothetical protein
MKEFVFNVLYDSSDIIKLKDNYFTIPSKFELNGE